MKKIVFIQGIKDILEIEDDVNETSPLEYDSLATLSIIAYIDEHFEKQLKAGDLKNASTIFKLMELIGLEHFNS